jgi:hypothetical protein
MTAHEPTRGRRLRRGLGALVAVAAALGVTAGPAESEDSGLTVVGVDTLGFPYIDLVVGGLAGPGAAAQSAVSVSQFGQRVPVTTTWLLSESQPLAVVTDAGSASVAQVQGIVGELVQAMPPEVPMALVSSTADRVSPASVNRDAFMAALQRQVPSTTRPVSAGVTTAASAGIQHVFVVTSCTSPPPSAPPIGVIADVLGVGPGCTDAWRSALSGRAGRFVSASDTTGALAALDRLLSAWRGSAVVVAQVSTRQPLQVSAGGQQRTVSLGGSAVESAPAPAPTAAGTGGSSSDRVLLGIGLVLMLCALGLVVLGVVRRRQGRIATDLDQFELPPLPAPAPVRSTTTARSTESAPRAGPAVIDLREPAEEPLKMPLMAVATPVSVRQAERSMPAIVAVRDDNEEPEAMAEERVSDDVQNEVPDQVGDETPQLAEDPAEAEAQADDVAGVDAEAAAELQSDQPADEAAEEPAHEPVQDDEPVRDGEPVEEPVVDEAPAEAPAQEPADVEAPAARAELPPVEFHWTPLQFSELVWRSDEDRNPPPTIDLREPGAVDVREKTGRRQKARRKTNR